LDADAGENGHVIYALEPDASRSSSLFRVDPGTGSVRLASELLPASDVTNATYHVTVIARDAGRPVRSAALRLSVMVRSTSEHAGCVTSLCGGAENASTGKRMYGIRKYNANLQSDKKSLVFHKLVWCIFKWGGQVDYRLFFSEIT